MIKLAKRLLTETDKRLLFKFVYNFDWKGMRAVNKFQKRLKKSQYFPAFLFISVTNKCNLKCQGCWVTPTKPEAELSAESLNKIINQSKEHGSYFFGILGGEPLLHTGLLDILEEHPDCYFLLFTNGMFITDDIAARMHELGNVSPLISIEGNEIISDTRRNGQQVYSRTLKGLESCRNHRLINGVATSICKSNIEDLANETFINQLADLGVHYLWYYIYRPVGPNPSPELVLSPEEIISLRQFIVDVRKKAPLMIVDAYWDHDGNALCPAAIGIGHHIAPTGHIEPCPPIQFAKENINDSANLYELFNESDFLRDFRELATDTTRGCILMDRPDLLEKMIMEKSIGDSSGRNTALKELSEMRPCSCHHLPGQEIPETSWAYRFAKKNWFFGFGAYG